jgi:hypothetical protein
MLSIALVLAAYQEADPPPVELKTVEERLVLPAHIFPALIPYMDCLTDSKTDAVRLSGRGGTPLPRVIEKGGDCTPFRKKAERQSDKLLRARTDMSAKERKAYIEKGLSDIEAHVVR